MAYGLKCVSEETNLNAFDWLEMNLDSKTTHFPESTSFYSNKVENLPDHHLVLKDCPNPRKLGLLKKL